MHFLHLSPSACILTGNHFYARLGINFYLVVYTMLFDWFDAKEASHIGIKLANDLSQELAKINNKNSKKELENRAKVIQKVFSQFHQFKQKTKPNFYKKSKLINEFRWRLAEIGHDKEFVKMMTKELVLYIN